MIPAEVHAAALVYADGDVEHNIFAAERYEEYIAEWRARETGQ